MIPVYNKWALTGACLDALGTTIAHRRGEGEIIVVDDASTDETASALAARSDVETVVRHEQNTGFQGAATDGAAAARGDVIVFLNNDTLPQNGWLDALLEQLNQPGVGIAGSMFLFPDGRVQEFGGIVWRDASAYHIGAGLDPSQPLFAKPRDVDYVSGAGLAIAKTFWNEIGGFDPELKPAYYEDTDLCMKARSAGKRVVVTPHSRIVHIMGGSKDVDPRRSHDTMMAANRQKFQAKWKQVLDREHWPAHRYFLDVASQRTGAAQAAPPPLDPGAKRLLFIHLIVPQFDRQSGDRRLYEMMRAYRDAGHAVTLLAFAPDAVQADLLQRAGIEVWHGDNAELLAPGSSIEERLRGGRFDTVYFASPQIARLYYGLVSSALPQATLVTDAVDLSFHRMHRDRLINQDAASVVNLPLDRRWELQTYAASDAVTSVSEEEASILRASGITSPVEIVSNFYSSAVEPAPFAGRVGIVIAVNMAHHPNLDALRWFLGEIWPRALAIKPDLQLTICGNGTESLKVDGALPNIAITGYLPAMDPVFQHARVNVAPLRVGAGVKGKVTEAMRNGLPTVSTPIGAEGLGEGSAQALLIESDPERFAQAIVALHEDEQLWNRLSAAGSVLAAKRFSREASLPALQRLLEFRWKAVHSDRAPSMDAIEAAFADPAVAVATFAAGAHAQRLSELLRSEPSVGAIVGADGAARIALTVPEQVPALIVSRAAYQWARMRGACASIAQFLSRMQEGALLLACTPELERAQWSEHDAAPLTVDVTVPANAPPERIAGIVEAVKSAANCRLRVAPVGDLSPQLPGEVVVSADLDGVSDVRIFDGPVTPPSIFGLLDADAMQASLSLAGEGAVQVAALPARIRRYAASRAMLVAESAAAPYIPAFAASIAKIAAQDAVRVLLIARGMREAQLAWAYGMPVTRAFRELPARTAGAAYVYASNPAALDELIADPQEHTVVDAAGSICAARLPAEAAGCFHDRVTLFALAAPEEDEGQAGIYYEDNVPAPPAHDVKVLAFYLPQFHPTAENDRWWGPGFTEWHNVMRAQPLFEGHYQPHVPGELGFYDLRLAETREAQARLARAYGVHGFIYYHYWFNGRRLLHRPLDEMLALGKPDMPFALCWANENWTRRWDGRSGRQLIAQRYGAQDDLEHIAWLATVFEDERYIRIGGKPLFLVYRASLLPDPAATAERWRAYARSAGIGELYLVRVQSFPQEHGDPREIGFDASLEFQPDWTNLGEPARILENGGHHVFDYAGVVRRQIAKAPPEFRCFPGVTPGWDNSARRRSNAYIFEGSTPEIYAQWLEHAAKRVRAFPPEERIVAVNAWNEWAEGNHLEPDRESGRAYLEATRNALDAVSAAEPVEALS